MARERYQIRNQLFQGEFKLQIAISHLVSTSQHLLPVNAIFTANYLLVSYYVPTFMLSNSCTYHFVFRITLWRGYSL